MKPGKFSAILLACCLSLPAAVSAAVPESGVYLNKDGTPVKEEQTTPFQLTKGDMPPMGRAVRYAMSALPHNMITMVRFTVDEYGTVQHTTVTHSSGSAILDEYAVSAVNGWQFTPARRGDKAIPTEAEVPVWFRSNMVAIPAVPKDKPLPDLPESVRSFLSGLPSGIDLSVIFSIDEKGRQDAAASIEKPETWNDSDKNWKRLSEYARRAVKDWTFTPAKNPDGDAIQSSLNYILHLQG